MTEYGIKIKNALDAIRQMHSDARKLLSDCDGTIGGNSIYGNTVTRELTRSIHGDNYMAESLYRYYDKQDDEKQETFGLVEGLNIYFFTKEDGIEDEPLLIASQIKYNLPSGKTLKDQNNEWDIWFAYFKWCEERTSDVLTPTPDADGRIQWIKLISIPLFEVTGMSAVVKLMDRLRNTAPVANESNGDPTV